MYNMKKIIISIIVFTIASMLAPNIYAQCNTDKYTDACIPKLMDGFNFLKSYKVDGEGGAKNKIEYSYVFTKGTQYLINICTDGGDTDGIMVTLFDSNRKQVTSSVNNGTLYSAIAYQCNTTGIYYITYTFKDSKSHCGGSVLGFKR